MRVYQINVAMEGTVGTRRMRVIVKDNLAIHVYPSKKERDMAFKGMIKRSVNAVKVGDYEIYEKIDGDADTVLEKNKKTLKIMREQLKKYGVRVTYHVKRIT